MYGTDQNWIDALRPYLYGGPVPLFKNPDGSVDAQKTIDHIFELKGIEKPKKVG